MNSLIIKQLFTLVEKNRSVRYANRSETSPDGHAPGNLSQCRFPMMFLQWSYFRLSERRFDLEMYEQENSLYIKVDVHCGHQ